VGDLARGGISLLDAAGWRRRQVRSYPAGTRRKSSQTEPPWAGAEAGLPPKCRPAGTGWSGRTSRRVLAEKRVGLLEVAGPKFAVFFVQWHSGVTRSGRVLFWTTGGRIGDRRRKEARSACFEGSSGGCEGAGWLVVGGGAGREGRAGRHQPMWEASSRCFAVGAQADSGADAAGGSALRRCGAAASHGRARAARRAGASVGAAGARVSAG